jgi:hypothetical protein
MTTGDLKELPDRGVPAAVPVGWYAQGTMSAAAYDHQPGADAVAQLARRRAERQAYLAKIREGLRGGKTLEQLSEELGLVEETPGLLRERLAEARRREAAQQPADTA